MAGKRVHQLAKELGIPSRELLGILQSMGEDIQNPLSAISEDSEKKVLKHVGKEKPVKAKPEKAKPAKTKPAKAEPVKEKVKKEEAKKAKPEKAPRKPAEKEKKEAARPRKKAPVKERRKEPQAEAAPRPEPAPPEAAKKITRPSPPDREILASKMVEEKQKPPAEARRVFPKKGGRSEKQTIAHGRAKPEEAAAKPPTPKEPGTKPMRKKLRVPAGITVREFAQKAGKTPAEVIAVLMSLGEMITVNQSISEDALPLVAEELGIEIEIKQRAPEVALEFEDHPESLKPRPPVVTVMGHVDHGKTSLLDAIRNTAVTDKEMGGITQHIGASVVSFEGKTITFIDTPGHESFTALRARGAKVTDIAVLVVAADDGVMPQTVEAIDHAKAAGVPIMVAVNKIDKPDADPAKVRQQLTEYNLLPEEWGGDTIFIDVSAKERVNLDHLLEMILLLAEVQDYRANPDAPASGNIIEARLDKGKGPVATLLVKRGTLRRGDVLIAGKAYGRARALFDDKGRTVDMATPSTPVEVLGLNGVPEAGDEFVVVDDERKARSFIETRMAREKAEEALTVVRSVSLEDLFRKIQEGETQEFNIIIKADTQGSVEAVRDSVAKIEVGNILVNIIHAGVGAINENDIMLAKASNAVVVGFNVRPDPKAQDIAEREKVEVRTYRVIYQLLEEIEAALKGMLKPEYKEVQTGLLEVRAVFKVPRQGAIAGALVKEGEINRNSRVRLVRDGAIIYEGAVASLRRFKDDVRSVSAGYECGVGLENFQDIKEGDTIEVFELQEIPVGGEAADS
jgi:translation initiation factor IF-2